MELDRLQSLVDLYEAALEELRAMADPALAELVTRLECRLASAMFAYDELLHPLGAADPPDVWPQRATAPKSGYDVL